MGACCTKLESVDHVESFDGFKQLVDKDMSMFKYHHKLLLEDKVSDLLIVNLLEF